MPFEDEEKTAFITDRGTYCYKVMPFGLKNVGATYQRLVKKVFAEQLGRNMEAYVDDMLVKSKTMLQHIVDLRKTFATLRKYGMRPNPTKCAFDISSEKFLGFIVSHRGIKANPKKHPSYTGALTSKDNKESSISSQKSSSPQSFHLEDG